MRKLRQVTFSLLAILSFAVTAYLYNRSADLSEEHTLSIRRILNSASGSHDRYNSCPTSQRVTRFVMTKIEKTGSSTLYSIFARFILENQVNNILVQRGMFHINWYKPRGTSWGVGPKHRQPADVLVDHARYNETMFNKHIVRDFQYIVPVREPESWISSAASYYFTWTRINKTADEILQDDSIFYMPRKSLNVMRFGSWFHLTQLQWLGFDYEQRNDMAAIRKYIDYIVPKIDIPILNEQFDASLLVLRKRFCWEYTDLFYQRYMVQRSNRPTISPESRRALFSPEKNLGEQLLYARINETWWNQKEVKEEGFWEEVAHFQDLNTKVSNDWCKEIIMTGEAHRVEGNRWHNVFFITKRLCQYLAQRKGWLMSHLLKYSQGQKKQFIKFQ